MNAILNSVHKLQPKPKTDATNGYRVVARGSDSAEIYLYGVIGGDWFGEGVTAKQFVADLKKLGAVKNIDLRINSEGGSVVDAEAIYTHLVEHPANVIAHIDGMAASAASFIAMAGSRIVIADSGFVMIHEARMGDYGTADEKRRYADLLDRTNDKIVKKYAERTKNTDAKIREWMKAETWFIGQEAVDAGFADSVVENMKVAASVRDPSIYRHLPTSLRPNRMKASALVAAMVPKI